MQNALVHSDRHLGKSDSLWVRSFSCEDMRILIICRGPIRKEAIDIFREMGVERVGILLSEKDSIVYTNALAPELRMMSPENVHRVKDYTGVDREERTRRIQEIINICLKSGYEYAFAGYGFMAEDENLVSALESAGIKFIGPCSKTVRAAGRKDEAKRTALEQDVSTTPGVEDLTVRTLLASRPTADGLMGLVNTHDLSEYLNEDSIVSNDLPSLAEAVLEASYRKGIDVISIDQIAEQLEKEITSLFREFPGRRVRLKAIGGGGGKGQRIAAQSASDSVEEAGRKAASLYREILSEVKSGGVGDNKNVLLELNIEQTRHHEIQLLGNGEWCISLGGRDCSLQMHEQKLLEISLTQAALREQIDVVSRDKGTSAEAEALSTELALLERMEGEAERFGRAVGLDSASTFECIVEKGRHYFMEVNTRIQVEHRVSELCYALRFTNPDARDDIFDVHSIVEAMAIIARHKKRLPKPQRIRREAASVEARLNATDRSLHPHAGGIIEYWSDPIKEEIRDDQGICIKNPDTDQFIRYRLAGAYDSNIALLVSVGNDRKASYRALREVLRATELEGTDLSTNLQFHIGLVNFFLSTHVYAQPTTRFVAAYITLVGRLKQEVDQIDFDMAAKLLLKEYQRRNPAAKRAIQDVFERKQTLLFRPIHILSQEPHILSAWLSELRDKYIIREGRVCWEINPILALRYTYHVLNMRPQEGRPAAHQIWPLDEHLLQEASDFYEDLKARLPEEQHSWNELKGVLDQEEAPQGFSADGWMAVRGAHLGHQLGVELYDFLVLAAERAGFFALRVESDLSINIPQTLLMPDLQAQMRKVLVPPPKASGDEVVAVTGGMYYCREAPDRPPMVEVGQHVEAGQPLYIIEVMKMFNKVTANFSGTIDKILIDADGTIVKKGQPLFKIQPDETIDSESDVDHQTARATYTQDLLRHITKS